MRRSAHRLAELASNLGVLLWTEVHWRRKWHFAGRLARHTDNRWSSLVLDWRPHHGFGRYKGRPCTRWVDPIEAFAGEDWRNIAVDEDEWEGLEDVFVDFNAIGPSNTTLA